MKHVFRFLGKEADDGTWVITDEGEVEHIRKVLRLEAGAEVEVFDGQGIWGTGRIAAVSKTDVQVDVEHREHMPRSKKVLSIAIGAVKPGDMDDVIPALTELGADHIHVFYQEGGDPGRIGSKVQERWRRIVLAAAKQCKRCWLPELHIHNSLKALMDHAGSSERRYFGVAGAKVQLVSQPVGDGGALMVLGSERGLNESEQQMLVSGGFEAVAFGNHVLRARTAAVAAMAILGANRDVFTADAP